MPIPRYTAAALHVPVTRTQNEKSIQQIARLTIRNQRYSECIHNVRAADVVSMNRDYIQCGCVCSIEGHDG